MIKFGHRDLTKRACGFANGALLCGGERIHEQMHLQSGFLSVMDAWFVLHLAIPLLGPIFGRGAEDIFYDLAG